MGLFNFFNRRGSNGGDGSSPQQAIVVGSVREEYEWIMRYCPGFDMEMQELHEIDGRHYDVLHLRNEQDEVRIVYFDINSFFGRS